MVVSHSIGGKVSSRTRDIISKRRYRVFLSVALFLLLGLSNLTYARTLSKTERNFYTLRNRCIQTLKRPNLLASRGHIKRLTAECQKFQERYPASIYGTRALYLSGMLWEGLYIHTREVSDWNQSMKAYAKVIALYPNSWLADDALFRSGILYTKLGLNHTALTVFEKLLERYPNSDLKSVTKARIYQIRHLRPLYPAKSTSTSRVVFKGFRYWSNPRYARLVMDLTDKVSFNFKVFKSPYDTRLLLSFDKPILLQSKAITRAYGKQKEFFKKASLQKGAGACASAILTFGPNAQCRIFTLLSPFRIVVDAVFRKPKGNRCPAIPLKRKAKDFTICLDPGHGGKDPGATGPHGIKEKNVVLRIARILKKTLEKKYGFRVIMTRNRDVFIPLEERVAFANSHGADLFLSIHINASRNRRLQGISTFCLSNTSDKKSLRLAARENGVPLSKMSSVEKILNDMLFCEKYNESYQVAHIIQNTLIKNVRRINPSVQNLGVRYAPFYVLAGAKMPSVLMELDFISNPNSERRLTRENYLNAMADGIARGVYQTTRLTDIARNFY